MNVNHLSVHLIIYNFAVASDRIYQYFVVTGALYTIKL